MIPSVEVTVNQYAPGAMCSKDAATYLGESESNFRRICEEHPDRLRPFNYLLNGEKRWSTKDLDDFIEWRKAIGVEKKKVG